MNKRLKELTVSLKNLKTKIPTSNECLNIRVHWNNDEDLSFNITIPLNKKYHNKRS